MRRALVLLLVVLLPLAAPAASAHRIGSPQYVSFLLDHFVTPDLVPGQSGPFTFTFNNTYPWLMTNITLTLEVYRYREIDVDRYVNGSWGEDGPSFYLGGANEKQSITPPITNATGAPLLNPGEHDNVSFTVVTYADTPHGSITTQASYLVRTKLEFDLGQGAAMNHSYMMSKGYFSDQEFQEANRPCLPPSSNQTCPASNYYAGGLNMTSLGVARNIPGGHLDGLLPDTAFSVADTMPLWPYLLIGTATGVSLLLAILFYAEENPSKYPRLARWWLSVKGKARQARPPKTT